MSRDSHAIEEDKNKIKNKNIDTIEYNKIMQLYNTLCPSLPSVRSLSESRKKQLEQECILTQLMILRSCLRKRKRLTF